MSDTGPAGGDAGNFPGNVSDPLPQYASPPGTAPLADPPPGTRVLRTLLPFLVDAWIVVVWFAVAGLIGALLWHQLTPLAEFTRTADNGTMDEQQLAKQIATDGWFFVIAGLGGFLSGVVLLAWRRRTAELMVLLVGAAGALATWMMVSIGLELGPDNPDRTLAGVAVGQTVKIQLHVSARGLYFVWSIAALVGAVLALWGGELYASNRRHAAAMKAARAGEVPVANHPAQTPFTG